MTVESRIQNPESRIKREPARDFTELIVWQKAHQFVLQVYKISKAFLWDEWFGLTSQYYLFLTKNLGYSDISLLMNDWREVSRLLERYSSTILDSFCRKVI